MPLEDFTKTCEPFGLTATEDGDNVVLGKGDAKLLVVEKRGEAHCFVSLVDDPVTGTVAGQVLNPSDQDDIPSHAATCARDMAANLGLKDPEPKAKAKPEESAKVPEKEGPEGYDALHVDELHKLVSERGIEGRSTLTTKAELIKALEKDDKAKEKKAKKEG